MLYSDANIRYALRKGDLKIEGLREEAVQPASVDCHLSDRPLKVWAHHGLVSLDQGMAGTYLKRLPYIVPWRDQADEMAELPFRQPFGDPDADHVVVLDPGQFALASTIERFEIGSKVAGRLEGKSSLARLGLIVHTTAGFFDPGFRGYATLELLNVSPRPIVLRPGMPIAQMAFFQMLSAPDHLSDGKYQDHGPDPVASSSSRNFEAPSPTGEADGLTPGGWPG